MTAARLGLDDGDLWFASVAVRARGVDPIVARLRTEHALRVASLHPARLPRRAILFVRRLDDPLPGALPLRRAAVGPPRAWEDAFRRGLEQRLASAARPGAGPVPPGADAVLFDDLSHLLAWLGRDVADRVATTRWWWRDVLAGDPPIVALARRWREEARSVPAALERLSEMGELARVVGVLARADVEAIALAIAREFGAVALARAIVARLAEVAELRDARRAANPSAAADELTGVDDAPPWAPWIGDALAGMPVHGAALVVLGLLIVRAPARIADPRFLAAIAESPMPARVARAPASPSLAVDGDARVQRPAPASDQGSASAPPPGPASDAATAEERAIVAGPAAGGAIRPARTVSHVDDEATPIVARAASEPAPPRPTEAAPAPIPDGGWRPFAPRPTHVWGRAVDTELGGLFYLLNVGLFLELYGDFTQPRAPGLALPIWDFVDVVGRGLLAPRVPDDPAWSLLASLAGREVGQADSDFPAPPGWAMPAAWLAPLDGPARASLDALAATQPPWLALVTGYVRLRLAAALAVTPADVAALVLRHRARVHVTATHVDVELSLAALPLPLRMAGLDRDPGWIPSAARTIAFHFD